MVTQDLSIAKGLVSRALNIELKKIRGQDVYDCCAG
jgi:hypothetical protein